MPRTNGSSGPTTVKSAPSFAARSAAARTSPNSSGKHSASFAIPPFPGAHQIFSTCGDCTSFHTSACSRPPLPIIRIFIQSVAPVTGKISEPEPYGVRSVSVNTQSKIDLWQRTGKLSTSRHLSCGALYNRSLPLAADHRYRFRTRFIVDRMKVAHLALGFCSHSCGARRRGAGGGAEARPRSACAPRHNETGSSLHLRVDYCLSMVRRRLDILARDAPWHYARATRA